jgi:hypothetical protein
MEDRQPVNHPAPCPQVTSADPFGEDSAEIFQVVSIDSFGGDLR